MHDAEGFDAFVAVVERGSLAAAARELGVPRPTLSRQLARLEERLGVSLLHRTTRRVVTTRAGEALYPRARRVLDEAAAAVDDVRRQDDVPRGLLRVTAPTAFDGVVDDLFSGFLARWPEVSLELLVTPRHVDLVAEGFDVAIRAGALVHPELVARRLMATDLIAVASPAFLARHGTPTDVDTLARMPCVLAVAENGPPTTAWPLRDGGSVTVDGPFRSNDLFARRGATLAGLGVGLVPHHVVRGALADGRLVQVLADVVGAPSHAWVVWPERAYLEPKVRAFVDHVVAAFALPGAGTCPDGA
ncbi:MAG: LysR family transcriptional regulator [Alphaproteobacteria bacterium]|nr:LysR family transcriptional regulator [Alphaproteobacteria bacterium]